MRSSSRYLSLVGLLACIVGVVGYVVFGWRFSDGASDPVAIVIALVAVALAVGSTVQDRL